MRPERRTSLPEYHPTLDEMRRDHRSKTLLSGRDSEKEKGGRNAALKPLTSYNKMFRARGPRPPD